MSRHSKHRNRLEIVASALDICQRGAKKTHLMYRANLSFEQLNLYLVFMKEQGLLEEYLESTNRLYRTTETGFKYLEKYRSLTNIIGSEDPLKQPAVEKGSEVEAENFLVF